MATVTTARIQTQTFENSSIGRVAFLMERPDINAVYTEKRTPGTVYAYYNPSNGFAELYVVDPSGYKFMALG